MLLFAGGPHVEDAARIWSEATAARDGDPEVAASELSRPMIEGVLASSPRSRLLIALEGAGALGFAAIEPVSELEPQTARVRYLGVDPTAWGRGVGRAMMAAIPRLLAGEGFQRARLTVYVDNPRAVSLYSGAGWSPQGDPEPHPRSGRPEQRYELVL